AHRSRGGGAAPAMRFLHGLPARIAPFREVARQLGREPVGRADVDLRLSELAFLLREALRVLVGPDDVRHDLERPASSPGPAPGAGAPAVRRPAPRGRGPAWPPPRPPRGPSRSALRPEAPRASPAGRPPPACPRPARARARAGPRPPTAPSTRARSRASP